MAKRKSKLRWLKLIPAVALIGFIGYAKWATDPVGDGSPRTLTFAKSRGLVGVLEELQTKGVIRSAAACRVIANVRNVSKVVDAGSYKVAPSMSAAEILKALNMPLKQLVRIPEQRWVARVAELLEQKGVVKASEYIDFAKNPKKLDLGDRFNGVKSLEGYLYPDTYNFPANVGAELVIKRQLLNFATRTKELNIQPKDMHRILTIASMLELEGRTQDEKHMIAGVIQNRVRIGMRLQIDATVNYGMQIWRPLLYADYTKVKSPYNTYLHKGLPPGPICSPTVDSIKAALKPTAHNHLYYITMPDGVTRFTPTYEAHLKNIAERDKMKAKKK
ncbi:MAG TPA: endolytic transglycosylase MltG [Fimbriimonas sp.]|nr:endolytic transglycosylase MltG [Fimbriimonas sp.]